MLAALAKDRNPAGDSGNSPGVCVICVERTFLPIAIVYAFIHRGYVEILDSAASVDGILDRNRLPSAAFVGPPAAFRGDLLARLAQRCGDGQTGVGILTGPTVERLSASVASMAVEQRRPFGPAAILGEQLPSQGGAGTWLRLVPLDGLQDITDLQWARRPLDGLGFQIHGDNIDAHLGVAVLCGRPPTTGPFGSAEKLHACQLGDFCRRSARTNLPRFAIHDVRAKVIVLESCSGIGLGNSGFPESLSLVLNAVEAGTLAFISSYKVIRPLRCAPLLVFLLLRCGLTAGAATARLSALHQAVTGDAPSYLLVGDPELSFVADLEEAETDVVVRSLPSQIEIPLPKGNIGLVKIAFQIDRELTGRPAKNAGINIDISYSGALDRADLRIQYWEGDNTLVVYVFGPAPFTVTSIFASIRANEANSSLETHLSRLERNLTFWEWVHTNCAGAFGLMPKPSLNEMATDVGKIVVTRQKWNLLARNCVAGTQHDATRNGLSGSPASSLATAVSSADKSLVEGLQKWNLAPYLVPFYYGFLTSDGQLETENGVCPYCGNGLFQIPFRSPLRNDVGRIVRHCTRCSIVSDVGDATLNAEVLGEGELTGPSDRVVIRIENTGNDERNGYCGIDFEGRYSWFGWKAVSAIQPFHAFGQSSTTLAFDLSIAEKSVSGRYNLLVFVVSTLGLSLFVRPMYFDGRL